MIAIRVCPICKKAFEGRVGVPKVYCDEKYTNTINDAKNKHPEPDRTNVVLGSRCFCVQGENATSQFCSTKSPLHKNNI